jgi:hypothetical protein
MKRIFMQMSAPLDGLLHRNLKYRSVKVKKNILGKSTQGMSFKSKIEFLAKIFHGTVFNIFMYSIGVILPWAFSTQLFFFTFHGLFPPPDFSFPWSYEWMRMYRAKTNSFTLTAGGGSMRVVYGRVENGDYVQPKLYLFLWVSDPLCLSSSLALHFFRLFFFGSTTLLTGTQIISFTSLSV